MFPTLPAKSLMKHSRVFHSEPGSFVPLAPCPTVARGVKLAAALVVSGDTMSKIIRAYPSCGAPA